MKKLVAAVSAGIIIAGTAATSVAAEEDHEVKQGDNLWDIADQYQTTVDDLIDINELKSTVIHPKQTISINNDETYIVKEGDTLISISNEFDVTVEDLKESNDLTSDIISIAQELTIEGANVEQDDVPEATTSNETTNERSQSDSEQSSEPETQDTAAESESTQEVNHTAQETEGKTLSVSATAYTAGCEGCSGVTSTGIDLNENPNEKVIAVDPNVIPLGSEVYVEGYGYAVAGDVGSAINGNKIDVHVPSKDEAYDWGVQTVDVTIVE
ncbi:3D (Asp-Asp-Asp) domain-containing protein/LysM repeat protein [Virgibacillus natechei]|uniref:3D (Asp-Asp-Asp) domain-containing protein/LysM repeat protein n=1 Tax=Virgibacillus natechei TaxID=1216297 RepID=A0ABS4IJ03_9BACI|nr:3D domain-containing protein [Virgibacillus natechei]MBP1970945.1 3D (Asp-Asp-Asp) domain-containing protein/LysM repeat protein [Virgibacillus natechei]UZD12713.1 LysM peptidoglycan-binding domain-containing protein [Virgibacillus natechei]